MNQHSDFNEPIPKAFRLKVGKYIKSFRELKGYSQHDLAKLMNVNRSTISKIENGKFSVSIDYLERLSEFLGFDLLLKPPK